MRARGLDPASDSGTPDVMTAIDESGLDMKYQRYKSESTVHSRVISENGGNCKRGEGRSELENSEIYL